MKRMLIVGTSAKMRTNLKQICGKSFIIDETEHLNHEAFLDSEYSALVLMMDTNPEQCLSELEQFSVKPATSGVPIIIATRHPEALYIRKALRRGASDYIDLNRHYFLINNRINNIMRLAAKESASVDAINKLLFYRCIGPAMMLEVTNDDFLQLISVNNAFFEVMGFSKSYYDQFSNILDSAVPEERESIIKAIKEAKKTGFSTCSFSRPETNRIIHGEYRLVFKDEDAATFLLTIRDITEDALANKIQENVMKLPGMAVFTYDPTTDSASIILNSLSNKSKTVMHSHISDPVNQKIIAPESYPAFKRTLDKAKEHPMSGNIDLRILVSGQLKWFRVYYRSIPDFTGNVTRIIGRLDDLEREDWMDVKGLQSGLCDPETHLPTFRTACQFIDQTLHEHKQGILLILNIGGLEASCKAMSTFERQLFLQNIVGNINNQFISTDIVGKFDTECFMVFMPETTSYKVAEKKAKSLIETVENMLPDKALSVNAGICIINQEHASLESIIQEASMALWNAVTEGSGEYRIYQTE